MQLHFQHTKLRTFENIFVFIIIIIILLRERTWRFQFVEDFLYNRSKMSYEVPSMNLQLFLKSHVFLLNKKHIWIFFLKLLYFF